ncbi:hypothetical protein [Leifsonia sp. LS-T14]|uniref:glycan biosynthesis hexose transferase WsfD n=1 Tax=unclassified Leifsonia TaxID=2663824 RepID=UPI0035A686DB
MPNWLTEDRGVSRLVSSLAIGVVTVGLMLLRTLWPVTVGIGDVYDGQQRYVCQLGLVPADPAVPLYQKFAILDWIPGPPSIREDCILYPSVQIWFLKAAQWLSGGVNLDLRWLILLNCVVVGIVVALIAFTIRRGLLWRIASALAVLIVLSDGVFVGYAGGLYGEFPGLLGIMLCAVGAVYLFSPGHTTALAVLLLAIGTFLTVGSKTQAVSLLVPIAALGVYWVFQRGRRTSFRPRRRLRTRVIRSGLVIVFLVPAVAVATFLMRNNPKAFQAVNPWELIAVGILGPSEDPAADLKEMGFPAMFAKYAGQPAGGSDIMTTSAWTEWAPHMTYETAWGFLLRHPGSLLRILNQAAADFFSVRPGYLGSFEMSVGNRPGAQDFSLLTPLGHLTGNGLVGLIMLWALLVIGALIACARSARSSSRRAYAIAIMLMVAFAFVQFFTAALGEAVENTRHMIYAIFSTALATVFLLPAFTAERGLDALAIEPDAVRVGSASTAAADPPPPAWDPGGQAAPRRS